MHLLMPESGIGCQDIVRSGFWWFRTLLWAIRIRHCSGPKVKHSDLTGDRVYMYRWLSTVSSAGSGRPNWSGRNYCQIWTDERQREEAPEGHCLKGFECLDMGSEQPKLLVLGWDEIFDIWRSFCWNKRKVGITKRLLIFFYLEKI